MKKGIKFEIQNFAGGNTLYDNFVLERKMTDIVNTSLNARSLMTIDTSLTEVAGMKKTINKYTYTPNVEKLGQGAKNSTKGKVAFEGKDYTVNRYQETFTYNDMEVMKDPYLLDVATNGASVAMSNEIKKEYFAELAKIGNTAEFEDGGLNYDSIVDALATINQEVEDGMFIIMNNVQRSQIRKDTEFKAAMNGDIMYSGQFGTIAGLPVLFSKLVPADTVYITNRDAVKLFVKLDGRVEQHHDVETKDNTVVYDRFGVVALVDETKSIKMTKKAAPGVPGVIDEKAKKSSK